MWNETFEISVESLNDYIKISCFDEDSLSNDLVGEVEIIVSQLCPKFDDWLILEYKGERSAEILISAKYTPPRETWS